MELRRRSHDGSSSSSSTSTSTAAASTADPQSPAAKTSDALPLPLPLHLTNAVFFTLFFSLAYYLLHRWRDKIRSSSPLHLLTLSDLAAIFALIASFIYLLGFFGIDFVQSFIARPADDLPVPVPVPAPSPPRKFPKLPLPAPSISAQEDELIVDSVVAGAVPSHALEARLGDCRRAAAIRRQALQRATGRSLHGLPLEGFDYQSILGQCCEMPVGYVQVRII